jgi:predicted deacylase
MPFFPDRLHSMRTAITLLTLTLSGWAASAGVPGHSAWVPGEVRTVLRPNETPEPTEAGEAKATPALAAPTATPEGEPLVIGTSVAGLPLEVFRFGTGPRELLLVAGIHGGYEWNTVLLADALIANVRDGSVVVPQEVTLYILPDLNPDGYARSHEYEGRANENGVDLNRNWPLNWHPDWNRAGCWNYLPIGAGAHPLSEPETAALLAFILDHDFRGLISYHSAALGIFPGGQPATDGSLRLAEAIAAVTEYPYPPREYGCEYTGQFADWAAAQDIAAVDVELSTHDSIDLWVNLSVLETFLSFDPQALP